MLIDPGTFSTVDGVTHLNAVLITHQHADHMDVRALPKLLEANPGAAVHAEPQAVKVLQEAEIGSEPLVEHRMLPFGDLRVTPVGHDHAVIHEHIDRIGNMGLLIAAHGEPSLFHPGDALDADPGADVDLLAVPVNAPWCSVKETIAFVRRIRPHVVIPIHDALLNETGRAAYLRHIAEFGGPNGVDVKDLKDGVPATIEQIG